MTEQLALPLNCQQEMGRAKERWDFWRDELSKGGFSPMISTPTRQESPAGEPVRPHEGEANHNSLGTSTARIPEKF
jgi:hypothetical protein